MRTVTGLLIDALPLPVLLGPVVLALGCGRVVVDNGSETGGSGSTSTGDEGATSSSSTSNSGSTRTEGSEGSSSTTSSQDTGATTPGCGQIMLADIAAGVGGFVLDGELQGDESGSSVAGAGDMNGDGLADVIVGAHAAYFDGERTGRAYVVFGKADADPVQLADVTQGVGGFAMDAEGGGEYAGLPVGIAGDMNGDGVVDVFVGEDYAHGDTYMTGRVCVVFGKADTDAISLADVAQGIGGFALNGEAYHDSAGRSVSMAGDVNENGRPDLVIGAYRADPNGVDAAGRTYVVFGKADTAAVSLADVAAGVGGFAMDGEAVEEFSGFSVSGAGDVNGDDIPDLAVGAFGAQPAGEYTGRTYVLFGKASTDRISLADVAQGIGGFAMDGEAEWDASGQSVSGVGDVNGDGLADIVVGASGVFAGGLGAAGRTYVVFGKTNTEPVLLADVAQGIGGFAMDGEAEGDRSGAWVSRAGDMNGDGLADVVVAAPLASPNDLSRSGRTYVVYGKVDTDGVLLHDVAQGIGGFVVDGESDHDYSGQAVSTAGDVNGDGHPDLITGVHDADSNGPNAGRTYVVFGGDFSCE